MRFNKLIIPALIILALVAGGCFQSRRSARSSHSPEAIENYVLGKLKTLAAYQVAFQTKSPERSFATYEELQQDPMLSPGRNKENLIQEYRIDWECSSSLASVIGSLKFGDVETEEEEVVMEDRIAIPDTIASHEPFDSFTIIAYPSVRVDELRTFAVRDDMIIRVYNPDGGDEENEISSWDPVM